MARHIETSIEIDAASERVWNVLTDFARMPDWNPFITAISGSLQPGSRLSVRIDPPGGRSMSFKPTVRVSRAGEELRWLGRLLVPGLFDGEHYFLLKPNGGGKTHFVQGEMFSGVLVGPLGGTFSATEAGFRAMNEALKARVEARPLTD